jgi:uncharacterized metal-binding protein YceD (DUF177 family)
LIPVHEITDSLRVTYDHIEAGDIELERPMIKKIELINAHIDIHPTTIGFVALFYIQFNPTFVCVRCLESFSTSCKTSLSLNYVSGHDPHVATENVDLTRTDIEKTYFTGSHIDLKIGIREAIILSLPIAPLCKEDCAGLCPRCGANKNKVTCSCVIEKPSRFTPVSIENLDSEGKQRKKKRRSAR